MPAHAHTFDCSEEVVNEASPVNFFFGAGETRYAAPAAIVQMAPQALTPAGGSLPAQQPDALPGRQLLHRHAGRLPAEAVRRLTQRAGRPQPTAAPLTFNI